jgi:hypothetical protein
MDSGHPHPPIPRCLQRVLAVVFIVFLILLYQNDIKILKNNFKK